MEEKQEASLRTSLELRRQMKTEAATTGIPMYKILEIAWDLYKRYKGNHEAFGKTLAISGVTPDTKKSAVDITPDEWNCVSELLDVLRSGDKEAIDAVEGNLKVFSRVVRRNAGKRSKQ